MQDSSHWHSQCAVKRQIAEKFNLWHGNQGEYTVWSTAPGLHWHSDDFTLRQSHPRISCHYFWTFNVASCLSHFALVKFVTYLTHRSFQACQWTPWQTCSSPRCQPSAGASLGQGQTRCQFHEERGWASPRWSRTCLSLWWARCVAFQACCPRNPSSPAQWRA